MLDVCSYGFLIYWRNRSTVIGAENILKHVGPLSAEYQEDLSGAVLIQGMMPRHKGHMDSYRVWSIAPELQY